MFDKNKASYDSYGIDLKYNMFAIDTGIKNVKISYANDSIVRYRPVTDEYSIQVKSDTYKVYWLWRIGKVSDFVFL